MSERTQSASLVRGLATDSADGQMDADVAEDAFRGGEWLLRAADDEAAAQRSWLATGVALLNCGEHFSAVRINAEVVWAAATTTDLQETDAFLFGALLGGPVFMDPKAHHYYALVSVGAAAQYEWVPRRQAAKLRTDARLLAAGSCIGVPIPERTVPDGNQPYWCVPARDAGSLCSAHAVLQLLARGRFAVATYGEEDPCRP